MLFNTNNENGIFKIAGPFLTLSSGCDISIPRISGEWGMARSVVFPAFFPTENPTYQNKGFDSMENAALQLTLERHKKAIDILARE